MASNVLLLRGTLASKDVSKEAEDIVSIRYLAKTGEDITLRKLGVCCVIL
jgi:hypothetical protein